jgi:hypothetical protein
MNGNGSSGGELQPGVQRGEGAVEGTNVVRVPFGVRRPRRRRAQRPEHWATLVLPFQAVGGPLPPWSA